MFYCSEEACISTVIFCWKRPLVASGAFFPVTEIMLFKFEYNLIFDNILVQNLNLVFQP